MVPDDGKEVIAGIVTKSFCRTREFHYAQLAVNELEAIS
jgi:hypothetical protein